MLAEGLLETWAYVRALAAQFGLMVWNEGGDAPLVVPEDEPLWAPRFAHHVSPGDGAQPTIVLDGTAFGPRELGALLASAWGASVRYALTSPEVLRQSHRGKRRQRLVRDAITALARREPAMSAASGLWLGQALFLAVMAGLGLGGLLVVPEAVIVALTTLLTLPFLAILLLRVLGTVTLAAGLHPTHESLGSPRKGGEATMAPRGGSQNDGPSKCPSERNGERGLPMYTILCPLYREAHMVAQLMAALEQLDYPRAKLDIKLILEEDDEETHAAAAPFASAAHVDIVIVPRWGPRTKPKALTYALQFARGTYVVVYDAEDIPAPDQLRRALAMFESGGPTLACVQAKLRIHNARESWLARQFAVEYLALFDALLPAFELARLPLPLGGTSNHFPIAVLERVGGWDPYNTTEDADLGIRLARFGYRSRVLASETYEEAPARFGDWLKQRTRWLKGWMQTYIVHTRQPLRLLRELGLRRFVGFHAIIGGLILSALVHPIFYLLVAWSQLNGGFLTEPQTMAGAVLRGVAAVNIGAGYAIAIVLGFMAATMAGARRLSLSAMFIPFYWLFISLAAYRALYQLIRRPFEWEKTNHGAGGPVLDGHGRWLRRTGAGAGMRARRSRH